MARSREAYLMAQLAREVCESLHFLQILLFVGKRYLQKYPKVII